MGSDMQSQWILEFLLRQPVEDRVLLPLISALSLSVHDHGVAKTLLLRGISSVINNDMISEGVLESLELIQELNHLDGILISESMKAAYCAVARSCIVKYLKENPEYSDAVDRIWRDRILDMEKREVHLISDWLKDLNTEIEEAMRDVSVLNSFSVEDAEKDALNAVKLFLKNTTDQMGPSFLEVVEKTLLDEGENVQTLVDTVAVNNHVLAEEEFVHENMSGDACSDLDMNCSEERPETTTKKCNPVSTPEFKRVQESLKSSVLELHKAVEDPLPDALDIAASIARELANNFQSSENQGDMDMDRSEIYTDCENGQAREGTSEPSVAISRPSILERNNTARTYEWDEDEDKESSTEGSRRRLHLPSPQSIRLSPLRKQVTRKTSTTGRRIKKKWSSFEESTLIDAVREYGRGKWKIILNAYSEIFDDRTEGDLKDKWRNLNK